MTAATELVAIRVHRPNGPEPVYRVMRADVTVARILYRLNRVEPRTGAYVRSDAHRRRLARGHVSLWLAVRHEGIPPTPTADPSAVDDIDPTA